MSVNFYSTNITQAAMSLNQKHYSWDKRIEFIVRLMYGECQLKISQICACEMSHKQ